MNRIQLVLDNNEVMDRINQQAMENQGTRNDLNEGNITQPVELSQFLTEEQKKKEKKKKANENTVNAQVAKDAGVSRETVHRYKAILEKGTPEEIADVKSGEKPISPTYHKIRKRENFQLLRTKKPITYEYY